MESSPWQIISRLSRSRPVRSPIVRAISLVNSSGDVVRLNSVCTVRGDEQTSSGCAGSYSSSSVLGLLCSNT